MHGDSIIKSHYIVPMLTSNLSCKWEDTESNLYSMWLIGDSIS